MDCFQIELIGKEPNQPFFEQVKRYILIRADDAMDAYGLANEIIERTKHMTMSAIVIRYIFKETIEEDPTADMTEYYVLTYQENAVHCQVNTGDVYQTTDVIDNDDVFDFLYGVFEKLYESF